jgi:arginyl-tRNA--protein-N-Asp/Glu arginylyltransferase
MELTRANIALSAAYPCAYLSAETAQMAVMPAGDSLSVAAYTKLVALGFRRSGSVIYRPQCPTCRACIPVRIEVTKFCPNRSQRRCFKRNQDLEVSIKEPQLQLEHYQLYLRYLKARHGDSNQTLEDYWNFLTCHWCTTKFCEFRLRGQTVMVAVVDVLEDSLSAVYTFYSPEFTQRSLGTYAVLWQIETAKRMGLRWLYLGYWIAACRKMAYKARFKPQQWYLGKWQPAS